MRLIDGDALLHTVNDCDLTWDGGVDINELNTFINEMPTAEPHWIPCSRDLPKEDGRYFCSVRIGSSRLCVIYGFTTDMRTVSRIDFTNSKAGFYDHDSEYGYADVTKFVTAWMPLPEPYKEVDNEQTL